MGCTARLHGRSVHTTRLYGPYSTEKALHAMLFFRTVGAACTGRVDRAPVHTRIDGPYKRPVPTGTGSLRVVSTGF